MNKGEKQFNLTSKVLNSLQQAIKTKKVPSKLVMHNISNALFMKPPATCTEAIHFTSSSPLFTSKHTQHSFCPLLEAILGELKPLVPAASVNLSDFFAAG